MQHCSPNFCLTYNTATLQNFVTLFEWTGTTKVTFAGSSSNKTKEFIMKQSNLIEIFSNARKNIADNFHLVNLTSKHLWPNMKLTHDILARHVSEYEHNVECSGGRATEYQVPDLFKLGVSELLEKKFSDGLGIPRQKWARCLNWGAEAIGKWHHAPLPSASADLS